MSTISHSELAGIVDRLCAEGKYKLADLIKALQEYGYRDIAEVLDVLKERGSNT